MAQVRAERLRGGLDEVRSAPATEGRVELIVCRPAQGERELLERASFRPGAGLVGDDWARRANPKTADGGPDPAAEVTVMSARAAALFADSEDRASWAIAGDQLFVDLDLSVAALPEGSRLAAGSVVFEVTAQPHLGCGKFIRRFGTDALKLVNSELGRQLRLRGLNARVIEGGEIGRGETIRSLRAG